MGGASLSGELPAMTLISRSEMLSDVRRLSKRTFGMTNAYASTFCSSILSREEDHLKKQRDG
jgi:hypothetical protein